MKSSFMEIMNSLYVLPVLLVLVGTIVLYAKTKSGIIILMIAGQAGSFLINIVYRLNKVLDFSLDTYYILNTISFLFHLLFAIGLLVYAAQIIIPKKNMPGKY